MTNVLMCKFYIITNMISLSLGHLFILPSLVLINEWLGLDKHCFKVVFLGVFLWKPYSFLVSAYYLLDDRKNFQF